MQVGSLLLPALALGLGCLIALCWLIYRLTRSRGREATLLALGGGLALLSGAGAVLVLWPEDRRASLRFESLEGIPLRVSVGELDLGRTPLELSLADFFTVTSEVPRALTPPPPLPDAPQAEPLVERGRGMQVRTRHGLEGAFATQFTDVDRTLHLRLDWGPMLPGRTDVYPVRIQVAGTERPALLHDVLLEASGFLAKGPRRYRSVMRSE